MIDWLSQIQERLEYFKSKPSSRIFTQGDIENLLEAIRVKDEALMKYKSKQITEDTWLKDPDVEAALAFDPTKKVQEDGK